jgi:hypothetical protein
MGLTVGMFMIISMCAKNTFGYTIKFNASEQHLLNIAYEEGKHLDKPEILQAIMLNETVAGRYGRFGDQHFRDWKKRSYGVMQIQFSTAYGILNKLFPDYISKKMTVEDQGTLLTWLTIDDRFNIHVARLIVEQLWNKYKNWDYVMLAYNVGVGNIRKYGLNRDPNGYLAKAHFHLEHTIPTVNAPIYHREKLEEMTRWEIERLTRPKLLKYYALNYDYHKVVKGDTFSKLAQKYFGDWRKWREIQKLNPHIEPTKIEIGSWIRIW